MTSEKFMEKMHDCSKNDKLGGSISVLLEFANDVSQDISNAINGKVCQPTALVVASVLENYSKAIKEKHKDDDIAHATEAVYKMFSREERVIMDVPMNFNGG